MELLTSLLEQMLSMALTALPVMAVVLLVRLALRRAPKKYTYLLWLVVAFRLVCPIVPESPVGFITEDTASALTEPVSQRVGGYVGSTRTIFNTEQNLEAFEDAVEAGREPYYAGEPGAYYVVTAPDGVSAPVTVGSVLLPVAAVLWIVGIAVAADYIIWSILRLKRQVSTAVRREWNVWECDGITTPFVLGLFRARIYIPFHLSDEERAYILAHEQYHLRHLDHWAKALALGILVIYWWNPAVWLCWVLFCRDMEMRCDEAVLSQLGEDVKRGYSLSLVSFALDRRFPAALAFGEHDAAKRVKNVLKWKKARPVVLVIGTIVVILVAVVCGTNASTASRVTTEMDGLGVHITARFKNSVKSWAIYEDVYQDGRLISSSPRVMDGFAEDGTGVADRNFEASLWVDPAYQDGTAEWNEFHYTVRAYGKYDLTLFLPELDYTGMAALLGDGRGIDQSRERHSLETGEEAPLYTVLLSTRPNGRNTVYHQAKSLTKVNDVVVQFRLVTSPYGVEAFEDAPLDLAQTLYDLRVETLNDPDDPGGLNAIRTLLDAMGVGEMGEYELALYDTDHENAYLSARYHNDFWTGGIYGGENGLWVRFLEPEDEEKTTGKWGRIKYLIRALVPDLEEMTLSFPNATDGRGTESRNLFMEDDDWIAEHLGYESLEVMGQSAQGIRTLLAYFAEQEDPLGDLARELFSLRADGVREKPAVSRMMEAMDLGGEPLGAYTVEWLDEETVQINFTALNVTVEELDRAMTGRATMILSVGKELRQVNWCSIPDSNYTVYFDRAQPDAWARNLGYQDLEDLGRTIEGLKQFLEYLGFGTETGTEVQPQDLAQTLYNLRVERVTDTEHVRELLDALGVGDIGNYEVSQFESAGDKVLHIRFEQTLTDAQNVEMTDIAYLLLALVEDADRVDYAFPKESGSSTMTIYGDGTPIDNWAKNAGYTDLKIMGASVGGIRDLLDYLNWDVGDETGQAAALLELAETGDRWTLMKTLMGLPLWDGAVPRSARVATTANYDVTVVFEGAPEDPDALDAAMARRAAVLLKLLPAEVNRVCWSWPGENSTERRMLHADELGGILSLSSDFRTSQPIESAADLNRFIRFLDLDDRAFLMYTGEENTLAQEVFANVLLERNEVGHLLDDYEPYDLYYDLDTYWYGTEDPMQCYLYYTLTRAQFRQFVKELDPVPEELQAVELAGDESDVARVTVSGYWSRGEVEAFTADLRARTQLTDDTASAPNLSVVSAAEEEISAAWYEDGNFDWDYDSLPTLTLPAVTTLSHIDPYALTLVLTGGNAETLTVGEDYYAMTQNSTQVEKNTYELMGSGDGTYQLAIRRRNEDQAESAVYFVPYESGKFVFKVELRSMMSLPENSVPFTDILGYDGYVQIAEDSGFWQMRTYYAVSGGGAWPIAESFGFDGAEDYSVDLDGDGVKELVTNVQFGGDGHEDVYVYRRVGDGPEGIQKGILNLSDLPNHDDWGANSTAASYDPETGLFRIRYAQKNTEDYGVLEFRGLDRFKFVDSVS